MTERRGLWHAAIVFVASAICSTQGFAQDALAQATDDGLELVESRFQALYRRPGTTLGQYRRIALLNCYVEFREGWLENQNRGKRSFNFVTPEDMARIKTTLADEFAEIMAEVLEENGAYEVVAVAARDVLLLRPAILNLDVGAGIYGTRNQLPETAGAASMTLYLELYDSATSTLIGWAGDARSEPISDRAAVRRVLRRWAGSILDTLEQDSGAGR